MTIKNPHSLAEPAAPAYAPASPARASERPDCWQLQHAKARFSELVRKARNEGPQYVSVHGRDEVVVLAAEEYHRLKGLRSGSALVAAFQMAPDLEFDFGADSAPGQPMPVRDVLL